MRQSKQAWACGLAVVILVSGWGLSTPWAREQYTIVREVNSAAILAALGGGIDPPSQGSGAVDATTTRTVEATDSAVNTALAAIQAAAVASAELLDEINLRLLPDAVTGEPALTNGPQIHCEFDDTSPGTVTESWATQVRCSSSGEVHMLIRDAAGNNRGANVNASNQLSVVEASAAAMLTALQIIDNAETAASHYAYTSAGSTEDEHVVVASPAVLWSITATNTAATVAYLRCEDQDQLGDGAPGTDTLSATGDLDLAIPGQTTGAGITFSFARGVSFAVGIKCWITAGEAYASVAEVGADDVKLLYSFKP